MQAGRVERGRSLSSSRTLLLGALALLVGFGGAITLGRVLTHAPVVPRTSQAQYLPSVAQQPTAAPDFTLRDQAGQAVTLSALRGQVVVLTFMDPQCVSLCPINAQELSLAEADLAPSVKPVLLIVSAEPNRTSADVSSFVARVNWRAGWHWLLGSQADLQAVWSTWTVALHGTDVVHQEIAHVIDRQGRVVASFNAPYQASDLAAAITAQSSR